ncbi:MAG: leucine-rich repeat protein [Clostridia bacterium]|nr:leucine-rich repeat protein [Clostridia bacterium]
MRKTKEILFFIIFLLIAFAMTNISFGADEITSSSTINNVLVNWEYEVNSENEIENLVCKNPVTDLSGSVEIPTNIDDKKVVSLGYQAFKGFKDVTEFILPNNLHEIGLSAFEECTGITKIKFPDTLEEIGSASFKGCTELTNLLIPNSVKEISVSAFENCTNLKNIDFGKGVEFIYINAFKNCTSLTKLKIPKSLTKGQVIQGVFSGCSNITSVEFEEGMVIIPGGLCDGLTAITEVTIPNTVQEISGRAFANCTNLKKITILDGVTKANGQDYQFSFENHNEDLTIYCYKDTYIEQYAKDNNIKYQNIERPEDTEKLIGSVLYDTTKPTNGAVLVTIKVNKGVNNVNGWNLSNDKRSLTKLYTQNTTETIKLETADGRTTEVEVKIENIIETEKDNNENKETSNTITENTSTDNTAAQNTSTNNEPTKNTDTTTAKSKASILPKTGTSMTIFGGILLIVIIGIAAIAKYYKYRDIK